MRGLFSKIAATFAAFFRNWWKVMLGQSIYQIVSWLYDNPLWWAVEVAFKTKGVIGMMIGAMIINFCILFYYRRKRVPWLGWDKGIKLIPILNRVRVRTWRDIFVFFFLSITQDSFITTAYMRHGRENGLKARDIYIFLASSAVSTCYWAARNAVIVETARYFLKF